MGPYFSNAGAVSALSDFSMAERPFQALNQADLSSANYLAAAGAKAVDVRGSGNDIEKASNARELELKIIR